MSSQVVSVDLPVELSKEESLIHIEVPIALLLCGAYTLIGLWIHQYKEKHGVAPWIHESSVA